MVPLILLKMKLENALLWKRRINYRDLNRSEKKKKIRITPVIMFPQERNDICIYLERWSFA